jgi:hypothetical protein
VISFGAYSNLAFGTGTTQTLTNIDPNQLFKITSVAGAYEVTSSPHDELNLKDYGAGVSTVELALKNGGTFDLNGVIVNDFANPATFTSNLGGNEDVDVLDGSHRGHDFRGRR